MSHGDFVLEVDVDFLAVVEHRLIPAGVRSGWCPGKGLRVWHLFGRLLRRSLLMWVTLVWGRGEGL